MSRRRLDRPRPVCMSFAALLRGVFDAAPCAFASSRVALYVAALQDEQAFEVAVNIHSRFGGPDPNVLRERTKSTNARNRMIVGAAPQALLFGALNGTSGDVVFARWAIREIAETGEVPVVILEAGTVAVTTLGAIEKAPNGYSAMTGVSGSTPLRRRRELWSSWRSCWRCSDG